MGREKLSKELRKILYVIYVKNRLLKKKNMCCQILNTTL